MRSILLWTSIMEFISFSGICRFLRTFRTFTFWLIVSGWLMSLTWTSRSWQSVEHQVESSNMKINIWPNQFQLHSPSAWYLPRWRKKSQWAGAATETGSRSCPHTGLSCGWATGQREQWHPKWQTAGFWAEGRCRQSEPWSRWFSLGEEIKTVGFRVIWLQLRMHCNRSLIPPTTVCITQHGHNGELLVFALNSQQVPFLPQLIQCWANLHLSLL